MVLGYPTQAGAVSPSRRGLVRLFKCGHPRVLGNVHVEARGYLRCLTCKRRASRDYMRRRWASDPVYRAEKVEYHLHRYRTDPATRERISQSSLKPYHNNRPAFLLYNEIRHLGIKDALWTPTRRWEKLP